MGKRRAGAGAARGGSAARGGESERREAVETTVSQALTKSAALTGAQVDEAEKVRWLSGCDGELALGFFKCGGWKPYDAQEDRDTVMLVPHPWDALYVHRLEAMTYYSTGEYQRAENARAMEARLMAEFKAWILRRYGRPTPAVLDEVRGTETSETGTGGGTS